MDYFTAILVLFFNFQFPKYLFFLAAYKLSNEGLKVALVEKSNNLGGVLSSLTHDGFFLDLGCHLFDNIDDHNRQCQYVNSLML